MKVKFFTVPNLLTLGNLLCGSYAAVVLIAYNDFPTAMLLIVAAALFDFCDGFAARLLHSASPIGVQLDSLADMVSFGLVPSLALYCMYDMAPQEAASFVARAARYLTFLVVAFSALRLAKFNIDDSQHTEFCGLPTPANALLCLSLGVLAFRGSLEVSRGAVVVLAVVTALLLISPIRMFALKFKHFRWHGNQLRYLFIAVSAVLLVSFGFAAVPAIITLYIVVSTLRWAIKSRKKSFSCVCRAEWPSGHSDTEGGS